MYGVAICGGGGKTTIVTKYPNKFIDIDEFVWSDQNKCYHPAILRAVETNNNALLTEIYKELLTSNKGLFINLNKIVLFHHPINAEWLDIECIASIKPNKKLFTENIASRNKELQEISRTSWENLEDALEYSSHAKFEEIVLDLFKTYFD